MTERKIPEIINFEKGKKYKFIDVLGEGACGETILVQDEELEVKFAIKKFRPMAGLDENKSFCDELFERFKDEARILFRINHTSVVRVYNFFEYSESGTAFIVMEYISGTDLFTYLRQEPGRIDAVFRNIVGGFAYLERRGVLHRDIRPANILVDTSGQPKIIDFGFGKAVAAGDKVDLKSISINWWCDVPNDFISGIYDHTTEVYFIGKLFEEVLKVDGNASFKYVELLSEMICKDRRDRVGSFAEVEARLSSQRFDQLDFSESHKDAFRDFADAMCGALSALAHDAVYNTAPEEIIERLKEIYEGSMLDNHLPSPLPLLSVFSSP